MKLTVKKGLFFMKKFLSALLCVITLFAFLSPLAFSVGLSAGRNTLDSLLLDGESNNGMDYVYYSPVKKNDSTRYPLFIWLHGVRTGSKPRAQVEYGISNWASDEYQSRFSNAGGCFLFVPRATDTKVNPDFNSWDAVTCSSLKKAIDEFISYHSENIDMSRIYIGGYSMGATMTWKMLSKYTDFFAAGIPAAAAWQPTTTSISNLTNVSVWMFCCDCDYFKTARTPFAYSTFDYLKTKLDKSRMRITHFSEAVYADGSKRTEDDGEHYIWESVTYDMHMNDGVTPYLYAETFDGNGNKISFDNPNVGVIDWLSKQSKNQTNETEKPNFFRLIINFFKRLSKMFTLMFTA